MTPYGPDLSQREYGVVGTRAPRQEIVLGPTSVGPTMAEATDENPFPSVRWNYDGVTPYNIVFLHHTHTGGGYNLQPSGADVQIFNDWVRQMVEVGRSASELTMYITTQEFNDGALTTSTYAWKYGEMNGEDAQEVNPDAERCPD